MVITVDLLPSSVTKKYCQSDKLILYCLILHYATLDFFFKILCKNSMQETKFETLSSTLTAGTCILKSTKDQKKKKKICPIKSTKLTKSVNGYKQYLCLFKSVSYKF